jgi:hypothetical protein
MYEFEIKLPGIDPVHSPGRQIESQTIRPSSVSVSGHNEDNFTGFWVSRHVARFNSGNKGITHFFGLFNILIKHSLQAEIALPHVRFHINSEKNINLIDFLNHFFCNQNTLKT